jgi:hypothetical protein
MDKLLKEVAVLDIQKRFWNFTFRTMKTVLLFAWLLASVASPAQDSLHVNGSAYLYGLISYDFPEGVGFTMGTSIPFHAIIKEKEHKDSKTRISRKDEFISAELGGYHYPLAYSSIILNAGIGIRHIKSVKRFTELSFIQGVLRTIYDGKVYELDENGNIKEHVLFGRTYLTSGFSYSLNWGLSNRNSNLWFIQLKPSAWLQYPYNSFLKPHLSLQAGVSYRLKKHSSFYPGKTET